MDGCWSGEAEDEGGDRVKALENKIFLVWNGRFYPVKKCIETTYQLGRGWNQLKQSVLVCSHIVSNLHPSLQSWTARSQATSRTASGRYCLAGRTVSASRLLCHIVVTLATTCWAPAPSPVKGTVPGIAPCPSVCVSTSGTSWKWWFFFIAQCITCII